MKLPETDEEILALAEKVKNDPVTGKCDVFAIATYRGMIDLLTVTEESLKSNHQNYD
jgi:hypothetical protein